MHTAIPLKKHATFTCSFTFTARSHNESENPAHSLTQNYPLPPILLFAVRVFLRKRKLRKARKKKRNFSFNIYSCPRGA